MSDLEAKLRAAFREELAQGVQQLNAALTLAGESDGEKLPEIFTQIFSISHQLKGASRAVGANHVEAITGRMETLFYRLQSGSVPNLDGLNELILACVDYLSHAADDTPPADSVPKGIVESLEKFLNQETPTEAVPDQLRLEIAQTFFIEANEHLHHLRTLFTSPDAEGAPRAVGQEEIEDAFRKAHTMKGGARLIEFHNLENQAHALEETLSHLKTGTAKLEGEVVTRIGRLLDGIENDLVTQQEKMATLLASAAKVSADEASEEPAIPELPVESIPAEVLAQVQAGAPVEAPPELDAMAPPADALEEISAAPTIEIPASEPPPPPVMSAAAQKAPSEVAPSLKLVPSAPPIPAAEKILAEFKAPAPPPQRSAEQMRAAMPPSRNEAVKIQLENLDPLYKAVVALHQEAQVQQTVTDSIKGIGQSVAEIRADWESTRRHASTILRKLSLNEETNRLSHYFDLLGKQTRDLRSKIDGLLVKQRKAHWDISILAQKLKRDVRRIYTVPASNVFFGFRKMVTDIANESRKEVNLVTLGLEVEADRTVIQGLKEPVLHIVRNSLFHGIESPEDRVKAGKSRQGTLTIRLSKETTSLCAEVIDDGAGINFEKIRRKAVALGKYTEEEASKRPESELIALIFQPGFSTADDVNNIAGRGVGLSAVRKALEEIGGKLEVSSKSGKGCRFVLRIPLHVSTQPLILFQVQKQTYAIPVAGIQRLMRVPHTAIQEMGDKKLVNTPDGNLIFKPLREVFGAKTDTAAAPGYWSGVIIQVDNHRVFAAVDSFLGHRDAVIKKLGRIAESWELICGGLLMEDGRVALVVDPRSLAKSVVGGATVATKRNQDPNAKPEADTDDVTPKRILVVDDSITTRTLEKSILETYGYNVELAVDGTDALARLRHEDFDLVVTDLEMPRLNGFELCAAVKGDEKLKRIPIIMVTSVENPKDREKGMSQGADAYVVKGKFDQTELLQTIRNYL